MSTITINTIKEMLGTKKNIIFLEIGSNVGSHTKRILDKFKNIKMFCFEPDLRCIQRFKNKVHDDRCVLIETAISDEDSEVDFYLSGGD